MANLIDVFVGMCGFER